MSEEKAKVATKEQLFVVHILATGVYPDRWLKQLLGRGTYKLTYKKEEAEGLDKTWAEHAAKDLNGVVEPVK